MIPTQPRQGNLLGRALRFVRFSHTVFALPFALGSALVAAEGLPTGRVLFLILWCMITARTAAMSFNRLADWEIDKRNPRTADRHKLLPKPAAWLLLAVSALLFVAGAGLLNPLCLRLSPLALVVVLGYSMTKRFTDFAQFFLGLALAVSPVGAWLAVTGSFAAPPLVLALAVLCWVTGFDLIYATQDFEFDRRHGLRSMVVRLGIPGALGFSQILHLLLLLGLAAFGASAGLGRIYYASLAPVALALGYEHRIATTLDLEKINRAFFHSNAFVGIVFVTGVALDVIW